MYFDFTYFLLDNLEAAGVIGGYVSISVIVVSLSTFFSTKNLKKTYQNIPKWSQPIIGSLLGIIPGCGGTIVASSLYKRRKMTFGGLLAAFITTLGEGSFVLLGASAEADVTSNLKAFLIVNIVGFFLGIIFGIIVDLIGFNKQNNQNGFISTAAAQIKPTNNTYALFLNQNIGFYTILGISLVLAPGSVAAFWGGSIEFLEEITIWLCVAFTITCILYYLIQRFILRLDCHTGSNNTIRASLLEAVTDISMVITYVFIGLLLANFFIDVIVGPEKFNDWMSSSKIVVILIATFICAIPGCGGMIAVAVAYITLPNFPIAALIAGAIATSGDGIFPLLAQNKRDALIVTGYSIVVALLAGFSAFAVGF